MRNYPVTKVPEYFQGEIGLLISEDDAGRIWNVPKAIGHDDAIDQEVDVAIDTTGTVKAHHIYTHRGAMAYSIRRTLEDLNQSERRKLADSLLLLSGADLVMDTFAFVGDTNYYQPLTSVFNYHLANAVTTTPEEIIVRTTDLLSPAAGSERPDTLERQNPICIERPEIMTKRITITYPEVWTLTTVLEPYRVENQFGVLECNYETQPGTIVCTQHLALKEISAPKEQIADLVMLVGSGVKGSVPALVFRR